MAETERDFSEDEFSAALVEALRNFYYDSLKVEQIECLQWVLICLREDILAVLPTGFGPGGGTPLYGLYRYVPRNRVWFLEVLDP